MRKQVISLTVCLFFSSTVLAQPVFSAPSPVLPFGVPVSDQEAELVDGGMAMTTVIILAAAITATATVISQCSSDNRADARQEDQQEHENADREDRQEHEREMQKEKDKKQN